MIIITIYVMTGDYKYWHCYFRYK